MKSTFSRRYRKSASRSRESVAFKKDSLQEPPFFSPATAQSFFKPNAVVSRKCDHCEAEEKQVKRVGEKKEEEKPVMKMDEKKEEDKSIQKMGEKKEEEKPVMKMDEKKEEDKSVQKMDEKKEDKPVMKMDEKKEEDKSIQKIDEKKEEDKSIHKTDEKKEEKPLMKMDEKEDKDVHKADEKKEEDKKVATKQDVGSAKAADQSTSYINSLVGKGNSLPVDAQQFFKTRMGYDFSNVRIHTDASAQHSAKGLQAKAYAVDNNIVFNKGQYDPASREGKKLLAHELTHIAQHTGSGQAVLKKADDLLVNRKEESDTVNTSGKASNSKNKTNFGCEGLDVQGQTDANYTDSFSAAGNAKPSGKCENCEPPECVSSSGTLVSKFKASPAVTLPPVPGGLTPCETNAVQRFINTTLKKHELKHVAAFNTYNATVRTPYKFTGCKAELDAYIKSIHDDINSKRLSKANTKSDALDPFVKPIPCNCKD
jgi:hypothetical protein